MLRILRKYNKVILVIGGSILMVAFTLPQLPQLFGLSAASQQVAVIDGNIIRGADRQDYLQDWGVIQNVLGQQPLGIQDLDHYMLLAYEANKYGLVGGQQDGADLIPIYADAIVRSDPMARFLQPEQLNDQITQITAVLDRRRQAVIAQSAGGNPAAVDQALANMRGIIRLSRASTTFIPNSKPEAVDAAHELFDRAAVNLAVIPTGPTDALAASAEPEALEQFFNVHAATPASQDEFGISYLRPDAVDVEYVIARKDRIAQLVAVDAIDLRRFYDNLIDEQRTELDQNFGPTFAEARDEVERLYRSDRADDVISDIDSAIRSRLQSSRRDLDRDPANRNYLTIPADWTDARPSIDELARVARERLPDPQPGEPANARDEAIAAVDPDRFLTAADLRRTFAGEPDPELDPLRDATLLDVPAATVLFLTREFDRPRPQNAPPEVYLQQGLALSRPFFTSDGSSLFIRVEDARPESPPPSWREIEDEVRQDFARVQRYRANLELADLFREALATGGLNELQDAYPDIQQTFPSAIVTSSTVLRSPDARTPLPAANHPQFRDAVMAIVEELNPGDDPRDIPAVDRTVVVGIPTQQIVLAATITNYWPVTLQTYEESTPMIARRLAQRAFAGGNNEAFLSFQAAADRLGYEDLLADDD